MEEKISSLKKTARLAGLLYLIVDITGFYSIMYVPSKTVVWGDAAATAHNMLAHEFLFRTGIVSFLSCNIIWVFFVLILYRLFKQVNEYQAKLMLALMFVIIPIAFVIAIFDIASLMILKGEVMKALEPEKKQDLAMLFLNIHKYGMVIFNIGGLWFMPFGQLVYKSGFIPRIFGVLLIVGGIGYMTESLAFLLFPGYHSIVLKYVGVSYGVGELSMMLWLLIKGVQSPKSGVALNT
jgi:hypothetical protein